MPVPAARELCASARGRCRSARSASVMSAVGADHGATDTIGVSPTTAPNARSVCPSRVLRQSITGKYELDISTLIRPADLD